MKIAARLFKTHPNYRSTRTLWMAITDYAWGHLKNPPRNPDGTVDESGPIRVFRSIIDVSDLT